MRRHLFLLCTIWTRNVRWYKCSVLSGLQGYEAVKEAGLIDEAV